jgi:hypothetical protein
MAVSQSKFLDLLKLQKVTEIFWFNILDKLTAW